MVPFYFSYKKNKTKQKTCRNSFKFDHLGSKMLNQDDSDPKHDNNNNNKKKRGIHQVILK